MDSTSTSIGMIIISVIFVVLWLIFLYTFCIFQCPVSYDITGDGLASTLFSIDSESGEITLTQPLSIDTSISYVVC